jgi:hypothetical protein
MEWDESGISDGPRVSNFLKFRWRIFCGSNTNLSLEGFAMNISTIILE